LRITFSLWPPGALLFLVIPPWHEILPGTALYRGSPSLLTQYAEEISFAGVVLTLAFGALGVWQYRHRRNRKRPRT